MLSHLSAKFKQEKKEQSQEPRAALFLNRFTRTLTIMYATSGIEQIVGISGENMKGRSFYYCIAENCLEDAVKCLETAKSNDSIAYLRFWFRDPRQDDFANQEATSEDDTDASMTDVTMSEDDEDGGVQLGIAQTATWGSARASASAQMPARAPDFPSVFNGRSNSASNISPSSGSNRMDVDAFMTSGNTSGDSLEPSNTHAAIFGGSDPSNSSISSAMTPPRSVNPMGDGAIELEAVVSCTSDGLVVCLRKARPLLPPPVQEMPPQLHNYANGLFAAPWAPEPMYLPPRPPRPVPKFSNHPTTKVTPHTPAQLTGGPSQADLMNSIREVAVFAWALTGMNGSLAEYSRGKPKGESQPPEGFPVWDPTYSARALSNQNHSSATINGRYPFGDPGL